ncbi:MAG: ABC transporter substrate-binding protein [Acidimicrobiales bacterium]
MFLPQENVAAARRLDEGAAAIVNKDGAVRRAPGARGYEVAALLRRHRPLVACAVALLESDASSVMFFWRTPDRQWLHVAIREVGAAEVAVTLCARSLPQRLTARELDVLTLLAGGLTNRQIASGLVTSVRTVSTHVEHILAKLGQATRAGAAAVAVERGWIRVPVPGGGSLADLAVGALPGPESSAAGEAGPRRREGAASHPRPLVIGSAFPLSGPAAADGQEMLNGSALAMAEINVRGGIGGRPIRHMVVDTDIFTVAGVHHAFGKLLDAGVDALTTGYIFMEDVAREAAAAYRAPYLHCMTSEAQARVVSENQEAHQNVFQVCPTERHYGPAFIHFLHEAERTGRWHPANRRVVFLETPLPSSQMVNDRTIEAAARAGWAIEAVETVAPLGADWPSIVERLVRRDPAAVMVTQFLATELAGFQRELARLATHMLVYAIYAPSVPEFLELAGEAAEGLVWATVTGTYNDVVGRQFRRSYEQAFGRAPGLSNAGIAYDEVHLLAQAWSSVADPAAFRTVSDRLRQIRYRGVNGSYYLDNPSQTGLSFPDSTPDPSLGQAHLVFQVQDGVHRIISPVPYAEAGFRPPSRLAVSGSRGT